MHIKGDLIQTSPYFVIGLQATPCTVVCQKNYNKKELGKFEKKIKEQYRLHWIVDEMDAIEVEQIQAITQQTGFPIGTVSKNNQVILYNHVIV